MVPLSGHLIIDLKKETMTDAGMAAYIGGCTNLTLLACNDNKGCGPDPNMPQIDIVGLPAYQVVSIRIWGKGATNFGSFLLSVVFSPPQPPCTNLGFEDDYTAWFTTIGQQRDGAAGAGTPFYVPLSFNNTADANLFIETSGNDTYGGFPKVYSGNKSLRIGNTATYQTYDGASVEQSFTVGTNTNFIYHYAVVLENPNHGFNEQPFFQIDLYNQNGTPISCGIYSVALPDPLNQFIASPGNPGKFYKPWTTISVNLTAYIGQNVTIKFTASDCSLGAHFGYAYLDCECKPFQITCTNNKDTICAGQSTTLSAPPGANSYLWSPGGATTPTITVTPTTTTNYSCVVTTQGNTPCVSAPIFKKIYIDTGFAITAGSNSPVCPNDTVFLNSLPAGLSSYHWTGPNGFADSTRNTFRANVTPADTGTYSVTIKNARGCTVVKTTSVGLRALPTIVTANDSVCKFETATISASGGVIYEWSTGDNTAIINVAPLGTTTYQVKVTDQYGCENTSSAKVVIHLQPIIQMSPNTSVCLGSQTTITASGGVSYLWNTNPTDTNSYIVVTPTDSVTTYKVIVTDINECVDSATVNVTTIQLPIPTISNEIDTLCKGSYTTITAGGGSSFLWNTGEVTPSISVRPLTSSVYTVTVKNIICSKDTSILQLVRNCYVIYVPNAFNPTGYNTIFKPIGEVGEPQTYQFAIYNRWGQLVFQTTDVNQGWDGKFNGEFVPAGAYVYYLLIDNGYEEPYEKIGTVTVIQ